MSSTKEIRLRLQQDEYDRLVDEADRRGLSPDALAGTYVHEALSKSGVGSEDRRSGLEALEMFRALRWRLPAGAPIDAVELVREGREELNRRNSGDGTS